MHDLFSYSEVLECFKRSELLQWTSFQISYEEILREGVPDCSATDVFATGTELGKEQWEDLRKRVIEHVSTHLTCQYNHNTGVHKYKRYAICSALLMHAFFAMENRKQ